MAVTARKRKGKPRRGQRSVYYEAEVFVSSVRVASQCFDVRAVAERWHDDTKARFESGRGPVGELTLGEVITRYRDAELGSRPETTVYTYGRLLAKLEAAPVANVHLAKLGATEVSAYLEWLRVNHGDAPQRSSFKAELRMLGVVLAYYRDEYDAKFVSPVTRKHQRAALYKGPVKPKAPDHYLTPAECQRFFQALSAQQDPVYHDIAYTMVVEGLRISEAAGIRRDAIDFERGTLTVKAIRTWRDAEGKAMQKTAGRTKTPASRRTIPLDPSVAEILRKAINRNPDSLEVFRGIRGRLPQYGSIRAAFGRAYAKAGIRWTGTHICRDTNATLGLIGGRLEAVQKNLGHTSRRQTEGYARVHEVIANNVPSTVAQQLKASELQNPGLNPGMTERRVKKIKQYR